MAPPTKKPNIVFIMTDQFRFECMGAHGHPLVKTPNLDRLAAGGVDMQKCFSQSAICMPSRVSFFTGQYLHTHGIQSNSRQADVRPLTLLPGLLKANGYQTAAIGKTHHGNSAASGFDHARICAGMNEGEENDYHKYLAAQGLGEEWSKPLGIKNYSTYVSDIPYEHCVEVWTAEESIRFLNQRDPARPFFLWTSFERPHAPNCVPRDNPFPYPPQNIELPPYDERWYNAPDRKRPGCENMWNVFHTGEEGLREGLASYFTLITMIDDQVGRIFKTLERSGDLENTIIVFSADHGDFAGEYGQMGKNLTTFDVLYRIPMIVYWAGHTDHERIYELTESVDLMPTLLELVDIDIPRSVQGRSFAAAVRGSRLQCGEAWEGKEAVFFENPCTKIVRTKTHKLAYFWRGDRSWGQLYDLQHDPTETENLYGNPAYAWIQHDLERRLLNWFIETQQPPVHGAGISQPAPPWPWYQKI